MKEARLLIYPDAECKKMLNREEGTGNNLDKAFCAGYLQGGIDTCQVTIITIHINFNYLFIKSLRETVEDLYKLLMDMEIICCLVTRSCL